MSAAATLRRRRSEQQARLAVAQDFACGLAPGLGVRAVAVFGSTVRGDFNQWSDIDVLVVADGFTGRRLLDRLDLVLPWPPGVQPVCWTTQEWTEHLARHDPIAVEATAVGVWLVGSAAALDPDTAPA